MWVPGLDVRVGALEGKLISRWSCLSTPTLITIGPDVFMVGSPSDRSSLANFVVENLV